MTLGDPKSFDPEHLQKWWDATCHYLMADATVEARAADPSDGNLHWMSRGGRAGTPPAVRDSTTADRARPRLGVDGQTGLGVCRLPGRIGPPIAANADLAVSKRK